MIDLCPYVKQALVGICPNVYFYYPASFEALPAISYFDSGNAADDGSDLLTKLSFQVDVWARTVPDCKALVVTADAAMRSLGMRRAVSHMKSDSSGYICETMTFEGSYNSLDGKIYSQK
jgi:hypothetical protein